MASWTCDVCGDDFDSKRELVSHLKYAETRAIELEEESLNEKRLALEAQLQELET